MWLDEAGPEEERLISRSLPQELDRPVGNPVCVMHRVRQLGYLGDVVVLTLHAEGFVDMAEAAIDEELAVVVFSAGLGEIARLEPFHVAGIWDKVHLAYSVRPVANIAKPLDERGMTRLKEACGRYVSANAVPYCLVVDAACHVKGEPCDERMAGGHADWGGCMASLEGDPLTHESIQNRCFYDRRSPCTDRVESLLVGEQEEDIVRHVMRPPGPVIVGVQDAVGFAESRLYPSFS